jgi:hypothetical protein
MAVGTSDGADAAESGCGAFANSRLSPTQVPFRGNFLVAVYNRPSETGQTGTTSRERAYAQSQPSERTVFRRIIAR